MAGKIGSGQRFAGLEAKLAARGALNPRALAAAIGRKKYGPARMAELSQAGRRRVAAALAEVKGVKTASRELRRVRL
jgi:hypothetical protein